MTRTEIYDSIQLLDHFGDHSLILGLTVGEIEILNLIKADLCRRLCDGSSKTESLLRGMRQRHERRQAACVGKDT